MLEQIAAMGFTPSTAIRVSPFSCSPLRLLLGSNLGLRLGAACEPLGTLGKFSSFSELFSNKGLYEDQLHKSEVPVLTAR